MVAGYISQGFAWLLRHGLIMYDYIICLPLCLRVYIWWKGPGTFAEAGWGKQVNPVPLRWEAPRPQWGWKESSLRYPHGAAAINPALQSGRELGGESEAPETHLLKCYGTRYFVVCFTKCKSLCRMHSWRLVGGGERSHLGHCDNKDQWTGSLHDRGQKTGMGLLAHWAG